LNGFLTPLTDYIKLIKETGLSIPLNGFPRSVWGESSHAMTLDLSIPLNGFRNIAYIVNFDGNEIAFNSIEWILENMARMYLERQKAGFQFH